MSTDNQADTNAHDASDPDADVVLGVPLDDATAAALMHMGPTPTTRPSSTASMPSIPAGALSFYLNEPLSASFCGSASARQSISQRSSHARALVQSAHAFVVFGGYVRLRESAREWRMKTWYCALLRSQFYFYPTKHDATRASKLARRVAVAPGDNVARVSDGHGRFHVYRHAFTFETARGQVFFCSAPSEAEQRRWVEQINQAGAAAAAAIAEEKQAREQAESMNDSILSSVDGVVDVEEEEDGDGEGDEEAYPCRDDDGAVGNSNGDTIKSSAMSASFMSTASSSSSHSSSSSATSCCACGIAFGLLRHHKRTCRSCGRAFCRLHCSKYAVGVTVLGQEESSSLSRSSAHRTRVCDSCSHRQHFIAFIETFTAKAIRMIRHDFVNIAGAAGEAALAVAERAVVEPDEVVSDTPVPALESPEPKPRMAKMLQELATVVSNPASYTVLNVLCLLKKYYEVPTMFTRALCLLIPLYERNAAALEEYWVQFLSIFVPLLRTKEPFSPSMQFFLRFIFAVCRRSNALALRTVWESLAFYEDARLKDDRVTMSYLMLLIISCSAFDGNSNFVLRKLLADAPPAQVDAIVRAMKDFLGVRSVLRDEIPKSLPAKWFNAICRHDMSLVTRVVLRSFESIEEEDVFLDVFDPAQTNYREILSRHGVEIPHELDEECPLSDEDDAFMTHKEREFDAQAVFVEQLTAVSERLRHVTPVEQRSEALQPLLTELQAQHLNSVDAIGEMQRPVHVFAPLLVAGAGDLADRVRLLRVVPEEGKVFSTRARAPTMIVFEACPVSAFQLESAPLVEIVRGIPVEDEDDLEDDELLLSAKLLSQRLRSGRANSVLMLNRQESSMLDAILCGAQDDDTSISSGDDNSMSNNSNEEHCSSSSSPSAPPADLLVQDARDAYEHSTTASYLASFHAETTESSERKRKLRKASPFGHLPGWRLVSLIAKSHDDLRQEVFAMQLMRNLLEIFHSNGLERLHLRPYEIMCTGANVGLIETLTEAQSIDAVKKAHGSLLEYFRSQFGAQSSPRYVTAQDAFVTSMAASSLYCYLFQIKDRHNGNIMLGSRGHIMHIDFGFMMGAAPGGAFSLEDAPFKLTKEMVDLMGGSQSRGYMDFIELFTEGFLAVRSEYIKLITLIHLTVQESPFPCFQAQTPRIVLRSFRQRLFLSESDDAVVRAKIRRLIDKSYNHWGTRQYDRFQFKSNGIMP